MDASIRVYDENERISIEADQIITAIGQTSDERIRQAHRRRDPGRGYFKADPVTLQTSLEASSPAATTVSGPKSVIEAVAAGKRAAESIERYLNGKDLLAQRFESTIKPVPEELLPAHGRCRKEGLAPRRANCPWPREWATSRRWSRA